MGNNAEIDKDDEFDPAEAAAPVQPAELVQPAETAEAAGQDAGTDESGQQAADDGLARELALLREALLRNRAELDNVQKRSAREIEKARRFALERFMQDLLPVVDSLDQALAAESSDAEQLREGSRLTRRMLEQTLHRFGLEEIDPAGEAFDPTWHEAISMQPSAEHPPNTVLHVMQKGFRLHDRLLRPARVIVSRTAE